MTPTLDQLRLRLPEFWQQLGVVDHHIIRLPTADLVHAYLTHPQGMDLLQSKLNERQQLLDDLARDPLRCGYRLPWWYDALELFKDHDELLVLGGNDSTKSWFGAYWSVKGLIDEPGIDWGFMHETETTSKTQQQSLAHRFLPPEWRDLGKKGNLVNVCFTEQMGFSENRFVLPNPTSPHERGSRGLFFFYKQDPAALTGYKLRGVWCDELITMQALEEIRTRLLGRGGKLLLTFTPKQGYSPPVMDFVAGAQVLQTREAKFLPTRNFDNRPEVPTGHMPYILQSRRANAAVLCAFTEWSPFRKTGDLEKLIDGKPRAFIKIAAYGWAEKTVGNAFPKFSYAVNVIKRNPNHPWNGVGLVPPKPWQGVEPRPPLYPRLPADGTNYLVVDPGENKNYVLKWYRVGARPEYTFVYREWPPCSTHGAWAEMARAIATAETRSRLDGYPGPAQRYEYGRSIAAYKKLILEAEGWTFENGAWHGADAEKIEERYMDSRMGGSQVPTATEENTSLIDLFRQEQYDEAGRLIGPAVAFRPTRVKGGRSVAFLQSLELINNKFDYDMDAPVTVENCPRWYVVEANEQSILAYQEYTGADGEKGALKDVIDPDWYFVAANLGYVPPGPMKVTGIFGGF